MGGEAEAGGGEGAGGVACEEQMGVAGGVGNEREEDLFDNLLVVCCFCFGPVQMIQS